jgi:exodeoxyribonuclease VII small subunit
MNNLTFEEAIKQLELIVSELDQRDINLNEALTKYQKGIDLSKYCTTLLEEAKKALDTEEEETPKKEENALF